MTYAEAALIMMSGGGKEPVLENLTVTGNGVYTPDEGVDGFDKVTVNVEGGESQLLPYYVSVDPEESPVTGNSGAYIVTERYGNYDEYTEKKVRIRVYNYNTVNEQVYSLEFLDDAGNVSRQINFSNFYVG